MDGPRCVSSNIPEPWKDRTLRKRKYWVCCGCPSHSGMLQTCHNMPIALVIPHSWPVSLSIVVRFGQLGIPPWPALAPSLPARALHSFVWSKFCNPTRVHLGRRMSSCGRIFSHREFMAGHHRCLHKPGPRPNRGPGDAFIDKKPSMSKMRLTSGTFQRACGHSWW